MYKFRLEFELSSTFECVDSFLELLSSDSDKGIKYTLYPFDKEKPIKETMKFIIKGSGFATEEEAYDGETKARNALMWYCTKFCTGVKFKEQTMTFTDYAIKILEEKTGFRYLNYKSRNNVYPDDKKTYFLSGSADLQKSCQVGHFIEAFNEGINIKLDDKEILAFELFNAYSFESSIRAKFLTLIIAIESMLENTERDIQTVQYIESLMEQTKKHSELNDVGSLVGCLNQIKYKSISARARDLIKKYLVYKKYNEKSAASFFTECYEIRSNIIHNGYSIEKIENFKKITVELYKMVSDLLIASAENNAGL